MYISDFKLVDILRDKMGEQEARTLVEYIGVRIEDNYVEAKKVFSTKEDLLKLELKILEAIHKNSLDTQKMFAETKAEFQKMFAETKAESQKQFAEVQKQFVEVQKQISEINLTIAELREETQRMFAVSKIETQKQFTEVQKQFAEVQRVIAESKADTLKWMVGFIMGSTVAIIGTILTVMKMGGW